MEIVLLVIILAVVVLAGTAAFVVTSRRGGRGVPVEPPPTARSVTTATAPPAEVDDVGAPPEVARLEVDEVDIELEEEALDTAEAEAETAALEELLVEAPVVRPSFRDRLGKARGLLGGYLTSVVSRSQIDQDTWDDLEEGLLRADVGVATTTALLDDLRARVKNEGIKTSEQLVEALKADVESRLTPFDRRLHHADQAPTVWLFVGVNGVGKTTTIGKLAKREIAAGHRVVLAAGDTFRAAAAEQLTMWAERSGADIVRGNEGGDPAAVIFDATERARARDLDLVLGDTAGRLHTKSNLMEELRKVRRVAEKGAGTVTEVLLVLDATTGQNGLIQAKEFTDVVDLTGVVLTKLDGSAKGGIVLAIQQDLQIPVKLVGLGEAIDDLVEFDPHEFTEALFAR
jgi:fused signal recognition particle receptor